MSLLIGITFGTLLFRFHLWIADKGFWGKMVCWFTTATYGYICGYLIAKGVL